MVINFLPLQKQAIVEVVDTSLNHHPSTLYLLSIYGRGTRPHYSKITIFFVAAYWSVSSL